MLDSINKNKVLSDVEILLKIEESLQQDLEYEEDRILSLLIDAYKFGYKEGNL